MTRKSQRLYNLYNGMLYRVRHKNIIISEDWESSYDIFKDWALAHGYTDLKYLHRINPSLGFVPDNCEWVDTLASTRPKKATKSNYCIYCGDVISKKAEYDKCRKCAGIARRINPDMDKYAYRRNWALQKKYNITIDIFNAMLEKQKGKCAICGKQMSLPTRSRGQGLDIAAVDHCHTTNVVRGILCNACNKGVGLLNDDIGILQNAINYLKDTNETISNNSEST